MYIDVTPVCVRHSLVRLLLTVFRCLHHQGVDDGGSRHILNVLIVYQTTRRRISEASHLLTHSRENFKLADFFF